MGILKQVESNCGFSSCTQADFQCTFPGKTLKAGDEVGSLQCLSSKLGKMGVAASVVEA